MSEQKNKEVPVTEEVAQPVAEPELAEVKPEAQESDPHAEVVVEQSLELEAAQEEIAKLKDAFLRARAEEENVRRRTEKEIANSRKFAVDAFAKEMLKQGIRLSSNGRIHLSSAHTDEDIDKTVAAAAAVLPTL